MPDKKTFKDGIPTADEEALQAPVVDPVWMASGSPFLGLRAMGSLAAQALLLNAIGSPLSKLGQYAAIPKPNMANVDKSINYAAKKSYNSPGGIPNNFRYGVGQVMQSSGMKDYMRDYIDDDRYRQALKSGEIYSEYKPSVVSGAFGRMLHYFPDKIAKRVPVEALEELVP